MHKWAIPLIWVLGLGLAIPAGALSSVHKPYGRGDTCGPWDFRRTNSGFWISVIVIVVGFIIPLAVLLFPFVALTMQLCGAREPRLEPPHSRTALTSLALTSVFFVTRLPWEIFTMVNLFQTSPLGMRGVLTSTGGTPYNVTSFQTEVIMYSIVYLAVVIDPILYFALNPDYRKGLVVVWRGLYCNQDPVQREREAAEKRARKQQQRQFGARNRLPPQARANQDSLIQQRQPQIVASSQPGVAYHPYPPQQPQMGVNYVQLQGQGQGQQMLIPDQQFLDNSFERLSPALPPVFEYGGLKYIDTARVEPKIGYSPEKTPPKTPETPHYRQKPFMPPNFGGIPVYPPGSAVEMAELSLSPEPHQDQNRESFHLEALDGSPGNTLRSRRAKDGLDETVEMLTESPGNKQRRRTQESQQSSGYQSTNGTGVSTSRPTSPLDRPGSRASGVVIEISGRTRSRQDLCPDVPRSKFEHSV